MVRRSQWCVVFLVLLVIGLAPAWLEGGPSKGRFVMVTRSGAHIPAAGPPRIEGQVAYFRTPRGTPVAINVYNLDVAATEEVNGVDLPIEVQDLRPEGDVGEPGSEAASDRAVAGYTITNADLKRLRSGRLFIQGGNLPEFTAKERAVATGRIAPEELQKERRTKWESRGKALKARRAELERRHKLLMDRKRDLEQSIQTVGAASAQKLGGQLDGVKEQIVKVTQELAEVDRRWKALREEARRTGVPEEWLR